MISQSLVNRPRRRATPWMKLDLLFRRVCQWLMLLVPGAGAGWIAAFRMSDHADHRASVCHQGHWR
jgi:hypothetical protein